MGWVGVGGVTWVGTVGAREAMCNGVMGFLMSPLEGISIYGSSELTQEELSWGDSRTGE